MTEAAFSSSVLVTRRLLLRERAVLRQAVAPLLADLAASGLSVPDVREQAHEEREAPSVCGWIQGPDGTGEGIWVLLDSPAAEQVVQLAEQFQEWAADQLHDAGRSPEWPTCPHHPSPPRRLVPEVRDGRAAWVCWEMTRGACRHAARGRRAIAAPDSSDNACGGSRVLDSNAARSAMVTAASVRPTAGVPYRRRAHLGRLA